MEIAKSEAWKQPRCSLQDPPLAARLTRPQQMNALSPQPGCSLQDDKPAASDRVAAAAGGCGRWPRGGLACNSSDNPGERHATCGGCRGPRRRTRHRSAASSAGNPDASAPGIPAGCTPPGQDGAERVERLAGNTGSTVAEKPFPPRFVSAPTLRKSDLSAKCRVCYRVLTASSPMGAFPQTPSEGVPPPESPLPRLRIRWLRPRPAEMAPFLAGPNIEYGVLG